ncbi:MAG: hypothetical protein A2568_03495 [Candidatus Yanofskybacteria bacterium RIFOXYD1_FULL_44_17]|uniref:Glycosyltransferase n=1 Tax=Candidatus Yanofskybacteria bacterium GW2011_GWE2_40_11 TaxID=1619033 RepID=A0A0G0QTS7_9BACT|nr:MAG: Glycosyltransferase [Candidatus Yanofskybacteria bacterium GW2011_GWE1_40_10]KKR40731.1 MAG: Glycosyltransferase [Candidatus Yanofskybacteria bacterium GW2011_GWE2_40_11]OGN36014.1 MAG: hypothetical protein A2207_03075 [Candidatus Yanofskybacteria bacterium RIFOXYA1_FULL_44_17]OGN36384.1 MAG: hypothetical protein A2241_01410 [Candidatus Yanofskybacteria bacterium RIFOXYA2_FULL_45_28]OGN37437.1 MAG: hypothetical protein A2371_00525 [Candidatus Yanofskybacteria bacterium RIFOXYB1_FULL_44_
MTEKSKILICTGIFPPDIGGPASYAKTLGKKLTENGHQVIVLTYTNKWKVKEDDSLPFKIVRVWRRPPKVIKYLSYYLKARRLAKKADLVLALNSISAGYWAFKAAKSYKKKFIVKIVGDSAWEKAINTGKTYLMVNDFQKEPKRGKIGLLHKIQKKICENANAVIVPSEYLSGVVKGWGVYGEKIRVVYNGTDFKPLDIAREEARKKIGIAGNVIVSIGRLVPWKGFKMLIKIMPKLFEVGQFFRLVIIGDGPEKKVLESMVKNMGLDRKVFVVGAKTKDELALYLAASDVFVLNTGYEGFSHQILEVMAAGVPVITTAVGGNKEIINQGENGFMVRYNDEFNLIEAIKTLHNMPELKEKFIEEGKKTVAEFSLERMYGETVTLIEEVLLPNKFTNLK